MKLPVFASNSTTMLPSEIATSLPYLSQTSVLLFSFSICGYFNTRNGGACGFTRGSDSPRSQFQNVSVGVTYSDHRLQCQTLGVSPWAKTVKRWQQAQRYAMRSPYLLSKITKPVLMQPPRRR